MGSEWTAELDGVREPSSGEVASRESAGGGERVRDAGCVDVPRGREASGALSKKRTGGK